ncbi:nucleoside/nucleotide kinase family protein [Salipiger thiooxidans]|uniref:phosphoribulokinase n=1 Tax=Salipiger thiooxidans TaxID=282683 RepID=UPI001CD6DB6D|nr:phosphoribulokinase [Salipiger thiooxidans]MCA0850671.1 phosphoribulokinase [Salipiger thiooxidans]
MSSVDAGQLLSILIEAARSSPRCLVALAGPPAVGKSTLAERLARGLGPMAQVIPMDGFHRDNDWLDAHGLRARKGAPETFDAEAFVALVREIRAGASPAYPLFDRTADRTLPGAGQVDPTARVLIFEGNYLLLDRAPWHDLAPLWDITVSLVIDEGMLTRRLVQRWLDHGLSASEALARAESNDLPNGRVILRESRRADYRLV